MSDLPDNSSAPEGIPCAEATAPQAPVAVPVRSRSSNGNASQCQVGRIAIVDDEPLNVEIVKKYLHDAGYRQFTTTSNASEALTLVDRDSPDVLILDIVMPGTSGLEILQEIREEETTQHLPVLILTVVTDGSVKREALRLGATDFLRKPVDPHDLIPRVRNALLTKRYQDQLTSENAQLQQQVRAQTAEVAASRAEVVHLLARAAEYHHDETGQHVNRVGRVAGIIARQLGFDGEYIELLELAAQLHDLGKIAVPDDILHHPGKLDAEQLAIMHQHCAYAKRILQPAYTRRRAVGGLPAVAAATVPENHISPLLNLAARIAQTHHEWWDGTGYPLALAGEDIPIEGRITAVADVYDALISKRPYKAAFPRDECFAIMEEKRGTHFDPTVLDAFFARTEDVFEVQARYMDVD